MGSEGITVPAQTQTLADLGNKQISELVGADYKLTVMDETNVRATGQVKNISTPWTAFDTHSEMNTGHFAVIGFPKILQGQKIVLSGRTNGDRTIAKMDDILVQRLENLSAAQKLTVKHNDKVVMTVDFSGVTKEGV